MVVWHHRVKGREFEQTLRDGEGQGNLLFSSPGPHEESDTPEQLNSNYNKRLT